MFPDCPTFVGNQETDDHSDDDDNDDDDDDDDDDVIASALIASLFSPSRVTTGFNQLPFTLTISERKLSNAEKQRGKYFKLIESETIATLCRRRERRTANESLRPVTMLPTI
uniref:Uncharacterized protein n=1 Tax=Glossina pallidipes TaxID=7398 RepID=A0A1A9ZTY9_GLOPL